MFITFREGREIMQLYVLSLSLSLSLLNTDYIIIVAAIFAF